MLKKLFVSAFPLLLAACGGGGTATSPSTGATAATTPAATVCMGTSGFSMSVTLDGSKWCAAINLRAARVPSTAPNTRTFIQIGGSDTSTSRVSDIVMNLTAAGPGTYTTADGAAELSFLLTEAPVSGGSESMWAVNFLQAIPNTRTGGTGTVTLTTLTDKGASGTFSFSAVPFVGTATGTRVAVSGVFNVTF